MHQPYKTEALMELLKKLYGLGWYGGVHELCTIKIEGGFEHNLRGRANESWDLLFIVKTKELKNSSGDIILHEAEFTGETLNNAILGILNVI